MSAYPLDDTHLEALSNRCWYLVHMCETNEERAAFNCMSLPDDDPITQALDKALSSTASAASLVCDLLVRAGVKADVAEVEEDVLTGFYNDRFVMIRHFSDHIYLNAMNGENVDLMMPDAPRLILALLDLAPGDRDGALKALREVGR